MKRTVLYPGSFDPLTNGHLDLIDRASRLFDRVVVGVAYNMEKNSFLTPEERVGLIEECTAHCGNVTVVHFEGLVVDAAARYRAHALLRGLRAISDFEYELQMALMNRSLKSDCETIFMTPTPKNSFVSSRVVREVAHLGGNFEQYVPQPVAEFVRRKLQSQREAGVS